MIPLVKGEDTLIKFIYFTRKLSNFLKIVSNKNATEKVIHSAIYETVNDLKEPYSSDMDIEVFLKEIIKLTKSESNLIYLLTNCDLCIKYEVLKSKYATEKVYKVAYDVANNLSNKSESIDMLNLIKYYSKQNNKSFEQLLEDSFTKLDTVERMNTISDILRENVSACASTMLWGLSGVGKTARVKEIDPNYTEIRLKNGMLPEEVIGGRTADGNMLEPYWYTSLKRKCMEDEDHVHILFIDEFTNVSRSVQALVMDIIENRRVNGFDEWTLPDNCAIVAAGNRPNESTAVIVDQNGGVMPDPTHRRFDYQIEINFNMNDWNLWALQINPKTHKPNIHPTVLSYCNAFCDEVMYSEVDNINVTKVALDPRRWEKISKSIYLTEEKGKKISIERLRCALPEEIAESFHSFYLNNIFDVEKIKNGEYNKEDFENQDSKLFAIANLISTTLISEVEKEEFILNYLGEEYLSLYNITKIKNEEILINNELPVYEGFTKKLINIKERI